MRIRHGLCLFLAVVLLALTAIPALAEAEADTTYTSPTTVQRVDFNGTGGPGGAKNTYPDNTYLRISRLEQDGKYWNAEINYQISGITNLTDQTVSFSVTKDKSVPLMPIALTVYYYYKAADGTEKECGVCGISIRDDSVIFQGNKIADIAPGEWVNVSIGITIEDTVADCSAYVDGVKKATYTYTAPGTITKSKRNKFYVGGVTSGQEQKNPGSQAYTLTSDNAVCLDNFTVGRGCVAEDDLAYFESVFPALQGRQRLTDASLSLDSSLTVHYYATLPYTETKKVETVFTMNGKETRVPGVWDATSGEYVFSFTGIAPQCIGDNISAVLYYDGKQHGSIAEFSVKTYCEKLLKSYVDCGVPTDSDIYVATCDLIADLLTYGAAAQSYRGYKTDELVTGGMTLSPTAFIAPTTTVKGVKNNGTHVTFTTANLWFDSVNRLRFGFTTPDLTGVTLKLTYGDSEPVTVIPTKDADGTYYVDTAGIYATGFDMKVTLTAYKGNTAGASATYSVNSYVHSMYNDTGIGDLARATYNYGVSAKAYQKLQPNLDAAQLKWAMEQPLHSYNTGSSDNAGNVMTTAAAFLYLAMWEHALPTGGAVRDRAVEHLRCLVDPEGNNAPYFDLQPYWNYPVTTAAIAMAKDTPTIWNCLTTEEKERVTFIMTCFAYVQALGTADGNNYQTGPGLSGNYGKDWNPNYRLANVLPMVFVYQFFGSSEKNVDDLLNAFDYDATMAKFLEYGFRRAYDRWNSGTPTVYETKENGEYVLDDDGNKIVKETYASAKDWMNNGGNAYLRAIGNASEAQRLGIYEGKPAGSGKGVKVGHYLYKTYSLSQYAGMVNHLFDATYNGGKVVDNSAELDETQTKAVTSFPADWKGVDADGNPLAGQPLAYTVGDIPSPVKGKIGMMTELVSGDGGSGKKGQLDADGNEYDVSNLRSSCDYCYHDFLMVVSALAAMDELDMYHLNEDAPLELYRRVWVGTTDVAFKLQQGYMSFSLGVRHSISKERTGGGYMMWKQWWNDNFGDLNYDELGVITPGGAARRYACEYTFEGMSLSGDSTGSNTTIKDANGATLTFGGKGKAGCSYTTVTKDGNTYVDFRKGAADPLVNLNLSGGVPALAGSWTRMTISVRLARISGVTPVNSSCRLRVDSSSNVTSAFDTKTTGKVLLGGKSDCVIGELTEEFQTFTVTVDYGAGKLYGYLNGAKVTECAFSVPGASSAANTLEWMQTCTSYLFNWYFSGSDGTGILMDDIIVYAHE